MLTTLAAQPVARLRRIGLWVLLTLLFIVAAYVTTMAFLPAPAPTLNQLVYSGRVDTGTAPTISWPSSQQAAVGAVGHGVTAAYGEEKPLPMASVAKVVAALALIKKQPLALNEAGPTITLTASDVAIYHDYVAQGGSVVGVAEGEKITQYQALQAILIPSGNNMAKSMVIWAFGSEESYLQYANQMLADMGLKQTHVADASGMSNSTVSTARELVLLGQAALGDPVIAQIVAQSEATIPVAGKIVTTNKVMGRAGIDGIKTGHTNASGGCFLFAATRDVNGEQIKVIGAIMAAPSIDSARAAAPGLIEQGYAGFSDAIGLTYGQRVATASVPWANAVPITAEGMIDQVVWNGTEVQLNIDLSTSMSSGKVGTASLGGETTDIIQQQDLPQPSLWWRLTHPKEMLAI